MDGCTDGWTSRLGVRVGGWTDGLGEWAGVALITAGYPSMPQYTLDMFKRNLTYSCMVNYFKKKYKK